MQKLRQIIILKTEPRIEILQSTCILPSIKDKYPDCEIIWVTSRRNKIILKGNPFIDNLFFAEDGLTAGLLMNREFAVMFNLDSMHGLSDWANMIRAREKFGYCRNPQGSLGCYKNNEITDFISEPPADVSFQRHIMGICGFSQNLPGIMSFSLNAASAASANKFAADKQLHIKSRPLVVIYLGKKPGTNELIPSRRSISFLCEYLQDKTSAEIILLAGPKERDIYTDYYNACPPGVVDGGTDNPFACFPGIINLSSVFIGMESLGLNIALALAKKVLVLTGYEKVNALELYGQGNIITGSPGGTPLAFRETFNFSAEDTFSACRKYLIAQEK